eukprot:8167610-Pyramimonas_sp.AAC.1
MQLKGPPWRKRGPAQLVAPIRHLLHADPTSKTIGPTMTSLNLHALPAVKPPRQEMSTHRSLKV